MHSIPVLWLKRILRSLGYRHGIIQMRIGKVPVLAYLVFGLVNNSSSLVKHQ